MFWKGNKLQLQISGTSHAPQMTAEICGLPGEAIDLAELSRFLGRRKATSGAFSTTRKEPDLPQFETGLCGNTLTGETLRIVIANTNVKSSDYSDLFGKPRPSHADYAAHCKDGRLDFSGGGEFSGRLTAPFAAVGGIAKQLLSRRGVKVSAYVASVGNVRGASYKSGATDFDVLPQFPALSNADAMLQQIAAAKADGDSVGGTVECVVQGFPAGLGDALFGGLESAISQLVFAIPAVKGVEFGSGFALAQMRGSTANDPLSICDGKVVALTNHAGGINGGVSNGEDITLAVAFRPTPSIAIPQQTVDLVNKTNTVISVKGRHDACIVPRAVPVVEGAVALALLDIIL